MSSLSTDFSRLHGARVFMTGGSRGIGLAIAKVLASHGGRVAIAAKTAAPHPKLPGTIYTAAAEIEAAGGEALPLVCDIRDEKAVQAAVDAAVAAFGGLDVVINNASAIHLFGTLETPLKKVDLMYQVNTRGTYVTTRACLPHLLAAGGGHVLNISPPLNMDAKWFAPHTAYTMAKYGMSMCVLGMAAEFADAGIAFNALWPNTAIYTAAVAMISGESSRAHCRNVDIMADAAAVILAQPPEKCSGNFFVDETVLRMVGVTQFDKYACVPGTTSFLPDFFLNDDDLRPPTAAEMADPTGEKTRSRKGDSRKASLQLPSKL
ncbi:short chain dehydrogenase [Thecamonas trahens ATCC 50062]|uniref:Hydroxysteroid dehydrogenase-like protein 2 n=1 Tax=Thecamonas trahens ATCC 50062 TaxID=461836 RepID=A0A0L0DRK0_THETB|nr:short chain dehydrogenase [Thecamonas trahens ATCC 50062]KNC54626.1 short chain dehydrogenase [Thecamonas trahens ATCC 50062]|eukprot:XP_013761533.1 short chain dehydrogenase [Thecamonas trahens ATCC 50062]